MRFGAVREVSRVNRDRVAPYSRHSVNVSKISFTGSTPVGRLLMKQSSGTLKKLSFELGGNAAYVDYKVHWDRALMICQIHCLRRR